MSEFITLRTNQRIQEMEQGSETALAYMRYCKQMRDNGKEPVTFNEWYD